MATPISEMLAPESGIMSSMWVTARRNNRCTDRRASNCWQAGHDAGMNCFEFHEDI